MGHDFYKKFTPKAVDMMAQMANAAEMEARMLAKMQELEARGIVRHDFQDSWTVLDAEAYFQETGIDLRENHEARV